MHGSIYNPPEALIRRSQVTADSFKEHLHLKNPSILDHCPPGFILDPVPGSPPLTATEARRLMREAIQDLAEDLPASEIQQLIGVFETRGLI